MSDLDNRLDELMDRFVNLTFEIGVIFGRKRQEVIGQTAHARQLFASRIREVVVSVRGLADDIEDSANAIDGKVTRGP
jgi:hypothetical protein